MRIWSWTLAATVVGIGMTSEAHATYIGPTGGSGLSGEYASASDSPFAGGSFSYFFLEDFEDHALDVPGVTASAGGVTSVVFGSTIHDSVDLDDGVKDGSGLAGDSYFFSSGATGITFTFDAAALGGLPTHAGLVWTDGAGTTSFEAFDSFGVSLGVFGPFSLADGSVNGETAEDRFLGVTELGGISAIKISNSGGGIEIDHLQYGLAGTPVPEPGTLLLLGSGLALGFRSRRRR